MKRLLAIAFVLFAVFSALFVLFEHSGWMSETSVRTWLADLKASPQGVAAVTGGVFGLLVVDIVLPVPSSVVMTLSGSLLGVWVGTIAAFLGAMAAALTAFWACRAGGQTVFERLVDSRDLDRSRRWFDQYGVYAIILSRPVPMLTEVLSCLAGLSRMNPWMFLLSAALGTLPICWIYSVAGQYGTLGNPWPAAVVALGIPALGWAGLRMARRRRASQSPSIDSGRPRSASDPSPGAGPSIKQRLAAWAELARLPNLFTVPGDVVAGALLAAASLASRLGGKTRADTAAMAVGVLAVYVGGVVLNDVVDRERDARQRPDRPIPSNRLSPRSAASVAVACLAGGPTGIALSVGWPAGVVLASVSVLAAVYNLVKGKSALLGTTAMGLCRGGAVVCGAVAVSPAGIACLPVWLAAAGTLAYVSVVTGLARGETTRQRLGAAACLPAGVLAGLGLGAGGLLLAAGAATWPAALFALAAAEALWAAQRVNAKDSTIPEFIGQLIRLLVVLQCAWSAAAYALTSHGGPNGTMPSLGTVLLGFALVRIAAEFASHRFHGS